MNIPKLDSLGRRKQFIRQPTGKRVKINDRVLAILQALHWFGDLSTDYLYEFSRHLRKDKTGCIKVLGDLFHERTYLYNGKHIDLPRGAGLLDRPPYQRTENVLSQRLMHKINSHGDDILQRESLYIPNVLKPTGPAEHRAMQSAIMASVALQALSHPDLQYKPQHEIIEGQHATFKFDNITLKTDGLCAIGKDDRWFYLFLEADRANEANEPQDPTKRLRKGKYWIDTVRHYNRFLGDNLYKQHVGAKKGDNGFLLNITVNPGHMEKQEETTLKVTPNGNKFILSQYYRYFQKPFVPPPILPILHTPLSRAGRPDFVLVNE
jgi:hypothetical protein